MKLTEEQLREIENYLTSFFRNTALPRFMRDLRSGSIDRHSSTIATLGSNYFTEFIDWLNYGGYAAPPYEELKTENNGPKRSTT